MKPELVSCAPLHFKFPRIEVGDTQKGHYNTLPLPIITLLLTLSNRCAWNDNKHLLTFCSN